MPRILATLVAVMALVVGVLAPVSAASASALSGSGVPSRNVKMTLDGFDAGNLISDAVFTDKNTMSESQIQTFFNSKVSRCLGGTDEKGRPIVCLKDFTISSSNRPADTYCNGYTGAPNETAARIIYRVAQSCGINPQVLIVMLQKEQGLVTHTWPSAWRYDIALGQGCPDDAACNPAYVGFFYQIYGAARQMKIYMEGRYFTYYAPGKTWNILYNPNRNCGSSPVYVANKATSALYYYTPYQPNAAALRAGYGEGDGCSAYGNRNFYNYFTDWFGSARVANARILRDASSGATYLISGSTKFAFPTAERAAQFTWVSPVETVSTAQLAGYADGGVAPRAVRTDLGYIYLLDGARRLQIASCAAAIDYGWNCNSMPIVTQIQLSAYRDAGLLTPSVQGAGATWLLQGGYRREIVDTSLLLQYGISPAVSAVADAMVREYSLGDPVLGTGVYADSSGRSIALLQGGGTYAVSPEAQVDAMRAAARALTSESLSRVTASGNLPVAAAVDGRFYILGNNGWTAVDAFGSAVNFVSLPSGALSALPQTAPVYGPHFVRERSSLQVYLISGGALQPVTGDQQRQITAWYGVSSTVQIVADSVLGKSSAGKGMVRTADGAAYLIDGTNRYRFLNCGQVVDWGGDCSRLTTVTAAQLGQTTDRGWLNYLVRHSDGSTWLIQSGTRREVVDPNVLAAYGISPAATVLSGSIVEPLALGVPVLGAGTYTDGASGVILVNPAGTFSISPENRLPVVTNGARRLTQKSFALLPAQAALPARMMSDGRALILTEQGWLPVDPAQYGGTQQFTQVGSSAWLGVPILNAETRPHFVRERYSEHVYLVSGGMLQPIADESIRAWMVAYYGVPSAVWQLPVGAMRGLSLSLGIVFRDSAGRALLSDSTTYFQFVSCDAARAFGRGCDGAPSLAPSQLGMTDGGILAPLLRGADGVLWLVQGGVRREVPDPSVLAAYGIGSSSSLVSNALIGSLPIGAPVVGFGTYRDSTGAVRIVTATGRVLDVPAAARVDAVVMFAKRLNDASFALLRPSGTMPVRATSDGLSFVLTAQGWLRVDPANYGSLAFSTTPSDVISALQAAGTATGPRFVREMSSSQVYLASGGLTPVTAEQQEAITRVYGVPSAVLIVADGVLR
ncbi:hypothetical protein [Microbacterium hydrocarbonoxydans]|uniref:hypothetical protein n=1 Tax=Microbacterium hydrocarbonoxydans TaxID=273678 RepID=UPI003D9629F7